MAVRAERYVRWCQMIYCNNKKEKKEKEEEAIFIFNILLKNIYSKLKYFVI